MEQYFDDVQDMLKGEPKLCRENKEFLENMKILTKYYEGGQWLKDYEDAYEAGELAHKKAQRDIIKLLKSKSFMEMMLKGYTPPAGRAITEKDIADSATDTAIYVLSRQAGEGGDQVARTVVLDDGNYHYAVTCMASENDYDLADSGWDRIFGSFWLG